MAINRSWSFFLFSIQLSARQLVFSLSKQHTACATSNNPTLQGIFCRSYMIRLPSGLLHALFVLGFTASKDGANMVCDIKERLLTQASHSLHHVLILVTICLHISRFKHTFLPLQVCAITLPDFCKRLYTLRKLQTFCDLPCNHNTQ